jgi:hypothetical protein
LVGRCEACSRPKSNARRSSSAARVK